jgi:hypothetical protein
VFVRCIKRNSLESGAAAGVRFSNRGKRLGRDPSAVGIEGDFASESRSAMHCDGPFSKNDASETLVDHIELGPLRPPLCWFICSKQPMDLDFGLLFQI